jgi:hypothetical protein
VIDYLCERLSLSRRELACLLALFVVSLPAVTPRIYASDEIEYFAYLRSLWFDHDLSFDNEYRYFHERNIARLEGFYETFLVPETETGHRLNFGTIGSALLWLPFYAVADIVVRAMRALGSSVAADGFSRPYVASVAYGSAFYGFFSILLSIAAARRVTLTNVTGVYRLARNAPVAAGVAVWLGTPLLFYMYVAPPFSHACSAFAVALFVTIWLQVRRAWSVRGSIVLGLSAALMTMVREQDVFFALPVAADFIVTAARGAHEKGKGKREKGKTAGAPITVLAGCAAFVLGIVPQLLAYRAINGHFGPARVVTRKMNWTAPHALEVLASPSHGFFLWTPLAALALVGLVLLAVRGEPASRRVGLIALLMFALQIYVSGSIESWTVAGAFGQRRFVGLTILLVVGLASLWNALGRRALRLALSVAVVVCTWWNLALIAEFGTRMMDRQRLELGRNGYDAFITLPRMGPELAWRYLTERESFYRKPSPGNGR